MALRRAVTDTSRNEEGGAPAARFGERRLAARVNDPIPPKIKRFVDSSINSVAQLELLLLLRRTRTRSWTAQSASLELRTSPQSIQTRIAELAARRLVKVEGADFTYAASPADDTTIGELERVYGSYRTRVITMIFDKPPRQIRDLAEAFRLRTDD